MKKDTTPQESYAKRMKKKGNKMVQLWIAAENVERIKKYAMRLRAK